MSKTEATVKVTLAEYDDMREELKRLRKQTHEQKAQLDAVKAAIAPKDAGESVRLQWGPGEPLRVNVPGFYQSYPFR